MKDRVLLVGSYPPPYGGCSVHVQRLQQALSAEYQVDVIDLYGEPRDRDDTSVVRCGRAKPANLFRALRTLVSRRASIVHFHVSGMDAFLFAAFPLLATLSSKTKTILTIHSGSFVARFSNGPRWRRMLLRDVLGRIGTIVTVNEEQRAFLESIGVSKSRLQVLPAFLPPVSQPSPRTRQLLGSIADGERLIVSSGYGQRHYGFNVILDALAILRRAGHRVRAIFCTYNSYDEDYMSRIEERLSADGTGSIVRDLSPEEFASILQSCDTYVRATDRDGDAVAIREALYYGKSVVASDCVERPPGVSLFRTDDAASLERTLAAPTRSGSGVERLDSTAELRKLLTMYREELFT